MKQIDTSWIWFYWKQGNSIIPLKYGLKIPNLDEWKEFQNRRATKAEVERWIREKRFGGIGIICGKISNNFQGFDFDEYGLLDEIGLNPDSIIENGCWLQRTIEKNISIKKYRDQWEKVLKNIKNDLADELNKLIAKYRR